MTFRRLGGVPNLEEYKIELNTEIDVDQRRYNAPTVSQVAAIWMPGADPEHAFERSVMVCGLADKPVYIRAYHGCYDPLSYPLFFPGGEAGWNKNIKYVDKEKDDKRDKDENEEPADIIDPEEGQGNGDIESEQFPGDPDGKNTKFVSAREYYCYKLQIRDLEFNILFYGGRLFQQYIVDIYIKIETMRLDWFSKPAHQKIIRADLYKGVLDTLASGEARASEAGRRLVLPQSMTGCDRDVHMRFLDAMTLMQRFGKPCYFVTMTCNPYWDEILELLLCGQTPQDRPDIVARVYRAKLRDLEDFLVKKKHFGEVAAYAHVTEFQKRGLPHEHFLLIMKNGSYVTVAGWSCGLFLLNFMEYWTGDVLSDDFNQTDMVNFRLKLAAILLGSELNERKGIDPALEDNEEDDKGDLDGVEIIEIPPAVFHSSNQTRMRTDFVYSRYSLSIVDVPMSGVELMHQLWWYICGIDAADTLKREWVKSKHPYPISLTLRKIKDLLMPPGNMHPDLFNLGVRVFACDETQVSVEPLVHYMDLEFCNASVARKRFLLDVLRYEPNESEEGIPLDVKEFLKRISGPF
ncbi:hypothetical protein EJB05_21430 [Eragrostis curvula]|uniref:Helitron helicase-like domain-containing protein n=1 Tax=Eragrostis curvula TaxID=38414 RepID=A0A5J9V0W9_9POAL|nr:hypothetical protein EJB05_21430 [Eragrostis curvula]